MSAQTRAAAPNNITNLKVYSVCQGSQLLRRRRNLRRVPTTEENPGVSFSRVENLKGGGDPLESEQIQKSSDHNFSPTRTILLHDPGNESQGSRGPNTASKSIIFLVVFEILHDTFKQLLPKSGQICSICSICTGHYSHHQTVSLTFGPCKTVVSLYHGFILSRFITRRFSGHAP